MRLKMFVMLSVLFLILFTGLYSITQQVKAANNILNVVGIYSETSAGHVSYRIGTGNWIIINVGDQIPANAEISVNVDRDWVELCPADNPNAVYEIDGNANGKIVTMKVADLLKGKPKMVSFPKAGTNNPKFANKVVVKKYLGRQVYISKTDRQDIKYGDVLDGSGMVNIIAINNTLLVVMPNGKETKVVGPLKFKVDDLLKGKNLYKYLNVTQ